MDAIRVIPTPTSATPRPTGDRLTTLPPCPQLLGTRITPHGKAFTESSPYPHPYYYRYCRLKETQSRGRTVSAHPSRER